MACSLRQACPRQVTEPGTAHQAAVYGVEIYLAHRHLIPPGSAAAAGYGFVRGIAPQGKWVLSWLLASP